jgi:hypothetical protein
MSQSLLLNLPDDIFDILINQYLSEYYSLSEEPDESIYNEWFAEYSNTRLKYSRVYQRYRDYKMYPLISLICCFDRKLNQKILRCTKSIILDRYQNYFFQKFLNLTSIKIISGGTSDFIKNLNPKLTELHIYGYYNLTIFKPSDLPQSLTKLCLHLGSCVSHLNENVWLPNLICAKIPHKIGRNWFEGAPNLIHLDIGSACINDMPLIPTNLNTLKMRTCDDFIPENLEFLRELTITRLINSDAVNKLPRAIKHFELDACNIGGPKNAYYLNNMPNSLTSLILRNDRILHTQTKILPRTLLKFVHTFKKNCLPNGMTMWGDLQRHPTICEYDKLKEFCPRLSQMQTYLEDLPPGLEVLNTEYIIQGKYLAYLPQNLKTLIIPTTIPAANIKSVKVFLSKFPPSLTKLQMYTSKREPVIDYVKS